MGICEMLTDVGSWRGGRSSEAEMGSFRRRNVARCWNAETYLPRNVRYRHIGLAREISAPYIDCRAPTIVHYQLHTSYTMCIHSHMTKQDEIGCISRA